ncbi:hypothetical protein NCC78_26700, partial [Micromonospora phytophila]|nr:hypothetical protein [Micromonospora phytophila]
HGPDCGGGDQAAWGGAAAGGCPVTPGGGYAGADDRDGSIRGGNGPGRAAPGGNPPSVGAGSADP